MCSITSDKSVGHALVVGRIGGGKGRLVVHSPHLVGLSRIHIAGVRR
jgi:hypothetical protein